MQGLFLTLYIVLLSSGSFGQDSTIARIPIIEVEINTNCEPTFFTPSPYFKKNRFIWTSVGIGSAWGGSMIGLSQIWYSQINKSPWNIFDDSKNWLQMDKGGHFYTAYKLNAFTTEMYEWSGVKSKNAVWYGLGVSLGFQTTLSSWMHLQKNGDGHGEIWQEMH